MKHSVQELSKQINWLFHFINAHDALTGRLMDVTTYRDFFDYLSGLHTSSGKDITEYIDAASTRSLLGDAVYRLKGNVEPKTACSLFATTIDATYIYSSVDTATQKQYCRLFNKIAEFKPTATAQSIDRFESELFDILRSYTSNSNGLLDIEYARPVKGLNGDPKCRLVWLTSFDNGDIEGDAWLPQVAWQNRADMVRDALGLSHYGSNGVVPPVGPKPHLLATLVIPREALPKSATVKRPTPLDGVGRRFKASFGDLRRKSTSWGRTVDLSKICGPRPHRGGREVVIENFRPNLPIRFTVLGVTKLPRADWEPNRDTEFLASLKRDRQVDQIAARVQELIK